LKIILGMRLARVNLWADREESRWLHDSGHDREDTDGPWGPRKAMFDRSLEKGTGELLLDLTGEQFIKLK
jgi:hypothetical protein